MKICNLENTAQQGEVYCKNDYPFMFYIHNGVKSNLCFVISSMYYFVSNKDYFLLSFIQYLWIN